MLQFLGPIANLAGTWLENKVEKTKADGQAKVAEAKAEESAPVEQQASGEKPSADDILNMIRNRS